MTIPADQPDERAALHGRVALVTGSSRGIGASIATALAAAGAELILHGRSDSAGLREIGARVRTVGGGLARTIVADLAREDEMERLANEAGRVDILVNNAAIAHRLALGAIPLDEWHAHVAVNLTAPFVLTERLLPAMRQQRWGRVMFISSTSVQNGGTVGPHYAATKGGLVGLTRAYASRVAAEGVTVNAVAPGLIDTDMIADVSSRAPGMLPVGRPGHPQEVADVIVLLATNAFITGQVINVNGGWYMG